MSAALQLLCAGAAQGLVKALAPQMLAASGVSVEGRFGAVGAMKEALLAGEPCDLMIVTASMIDGLVAAGALRAETRSALGRVRTGVAVRHGEPLPDVSSPQALKAALLGADEIYFPDALRSTAGIHFASVLRQLGIHEELAPRFRTFPNGATAMRALADCTALRPIGCTQVTEINYTEGVDLVAPLPERFELATVYAAAVSVPSAQPEQAALFIAMLAGPGSLALRVTGGFES